MYQVLYRKYRPRVFSDVVGQDHITSTLSKEIESGKVSHAYLFTGSRGTGKTTCAKILSKAVNCLNPVNGNPCNECEICRGIDDGTIADVAEIDAASNNGVENIRDIREEINFTPASCKYRVYIIDEVHMLSIGAFNALLKTLEEPPAHVKFILATTEVHKLPVTIVSRCQRFDFRRVTPEAMISRMQQIASLEGFTADDEALTLISRISDGGMRDALSLLDQCTGHGKHITTDIVCAVAGMAGKEHLFSLANAVSENNSAEALRLISDLHASSVDMERLCSDMINHFRNLMIVKTVKKPEGLVVCTDGEMEEFKKQSTCFTLEGILKCIALLQDTAAAIKKGVNRRIEMEMTFIRLASPKLDTDNEAVLRRIADLEFRLTSGEISVASAPVKEKSASAPLISEYVKPAAQSEASPSAPAAQVPAVKEEKPEVKKPSTVFDTFTNANEPPREEKQENPFLKEEPAEPAYASEAYYGDAPAAEAVSGGDYLPWAEVLSELMKTNAPLWGVLHDSEAYISGDFVLIKSTNPTLNAFIRTGSNSRDVKQAVFRITGKKYRLGLSSPKEGQGGADAPAQPKRDPLEDLISQARAMDINIDIKP
ncbi:MAG: DNA polymerase III subunit gamma/tau [Ruminococcaceae bacterium]|nr:DNA polymerase III subunit gamma/tau [Oscillospiraceae bacterium]MBE6786324.1 DNA polymerase III subunit gamma/tau [Oscillospiraceae bacterium]